MLKRGMYRLGWVFAIAALLVAGFAPTVFAGQAPVDQDAGPDRPLLGHLAPDGFEWSLEALWQGLIERWWTTPPPAGQPELEGEAPSSPVTAVSGATTDDDSEHSPGMDVNG